MQGGKLEGVRVVSGGPAKDALVDWHGQYGLVALESYCFWLSGSCELVCTAGEYRGDVI